MRDALLRTLARGRSPSSDASAGASPAPEGGRKALRKDGKDAAFGVFRWSDLPGNFTKRKTGTKEEQETSEKMEKILISAILATKYDRILKGTRVR